MHAALTGMSEYAHVPGNGAGGYGLNQLKSEDVSWFEQ